MHRNTHRALRAFPSASWAPGACRWVVLALCAPLPLAAGCSDETHDLGGRATGTPSSLGNAGARSDARGGGFAAAGGADGRGAVGSGHAAAGEGAVRGGTDGGGAVTSATGDVAVAGWGAGDGVGPLEAEETRVPSPQDCPTTVLCASDGRRVEEFQGCAPAGWVTLDLARCNEEEARCAALTTPAACEGGSGCTAVSPMDPGDALFYCTRAADCREVPTCAVSRNSGSQRLFPTSCLPPGWQALETDCTP